MINKSTQYSATFFIVAGEKSADNHGAVLMQAIRTLNPKAQFVGIGGKKMLKVGLKSLEKIERLSIMGFIEVIKHLSFFHKLIKKILEEIKFIQPIQIILIDYPGFNLRLAKKIKDHFNIPITYYISPQLWAWKEGRIEIIRKYIDQMLVIFPFEERWYKERGIKASFVGHPIFDEWSLTSKDNLCSDLKLNCNELIITLYPGSRKQELDRHLPLFIKSAEVLKNKWPNIQFILGLANELKLNNHTVPDWIMIENDNPIKALECADLAFVASGSATLEAAIFNTPMIIVYKMNQLSWYISRLFIKVDYAGMVNIIADEKIMPEYIQEKATVKAITNEAIEIISDRNKREEMKSKLLCIKEKLKGDGASMKAAEKILSLIHSK